MKKRFSLFKHTRSNLEIYEEAMTLMCSSFYKILRLNLKKDCYDEVMVLPGEKHADKGYSHNFSEWSKNYAMTGNIYKDDIERYLKFIDIDNIKSMFKTKSEIKTIKYRRNINGNMRWVALDCIPSEKYSEKNQIIYLYVYDIHDSLSGELNNTQFSNMVAEAITKSYLACVYLDIENNTSKLIYAEDYIKEHVDFSLPMRETMSRSLIYFTDPTYQTRMKDFCNFDTLGDRLKNKSIISAEYIGDRGGLCRANFIPVNYGEDGRLKSVIYTNRYVDGEILSLRGQLETERALVECLTTLSDSEDFSKANIQILKNICEYYEADRAYIFKIDHETYTTSEEYEWCNNNIAPQMGEMQNIKLESLSRWMEIFKEKKIVYIADRDKELTHGSIEYKMLAKYDINSLIVTPFYDGNENVIGFMGIDEPKKNMDTDIVIRSAATYIMEEKLKKNYTEELYRMSYSDMMTKTFNRAAYIRDMEELRTQSELNTGILYADVNGLKDTNDTKGHEAGDALIESAVALLKKYFSRKKKDKVYRIGGDEFVVISSDITEKEFQTVVANLKDFLKSNWILSCGGAWFQRISDIDQATQDAEKSMYKNKSDYYTINTHIDRRR